MTSEQLRVARIVADVAGQLGITERGLHIALAVAGLVNIAMVMMASSAFHAGHPEVAEIETAYHTLTPLLGVVLIAFAVPAAVLAIAILEALHSVLYAVMRTLLSARAAPGGPVRELLALLDAHEPRVEPKWTDR